MLGSLLITAVGSAICGAAPSMNVLIAGRGAPDFVWGSRVLRS